MKNIVTFDINILRTILNNHFVRNILKSKNTQIDNNFVDIGKMRKRFCKTFNIYLRKKTKTILFKFVYLWKVKEMGLKKILLYQHF